MSRLSLRPSRGVVATGARSNRPRADDLGGPGRPGKKARSDPDPDVRGSFERMFGDLYSSMSAEVKAELHAHLAELYQQYGLDPNGDWLMEPLPENLLRSIFGQTWTSEPIERHWQWKFKELSDANGRLQATRMRRKKGSVVDDEGSAPNRKRAKQLASQRRWRAAFDSDNAPRGDIRDVEREVVEDLRRQFPSPDAFQRLDGTRGRAPACCMHNA